MNEMEGPSQSMRYGNRGRAPMTAPTKGGSYAVNPHMSKVRATCARIMLGLTMAALVCGCGVSRIRLPGHVSLPETVDVYPVKNIYQDARVGVFRFISPDYAPRSGYVATRILYQRLLSRGLFQRVFPEFENNDMTNEGQLETARSKGYDLLIRGEITYLFEGSEFEESRVDQRLEVVDVTTRGVIAGAEAHEEGRPVRGADYVLFRTEAEKAPSTTTLMDVNAQKFCEMFAWVSPRYQDLSEDMKLVEAGYTHLNAEAYDRAAVYFERALALDRDNPHALVCLGLIYEHRGDTTGALKMFREVIFRKPKDIFTEGTLGGEKGRPLLEVAREGAERVQAVK